MARCCVAIWPLQPNLLRPKTCRPNHVTFTGVSCVEAMRLWSYADALQVKPVGIPAHADVQLSDLTWVYWL